jgi:hypothetical protein
MLWTFQGRAVQVAGTADIPSQYRSDRPMGRIVQRVLDMIEPWEEGDDPIETKRLAGVRLAPLIVPLSGRVPFWGIHAGHKSRSPGPSPFVGVNFDSLRPTDLFTVELVWTSEEPLLVRAYPGNYIPPLPWMSSAAQAHCNIEECEDFWSRHAYVYRSTLMRQREAQPPHWFRK